MGFFWRLCVPSSEDREKGDETKYTWRDYAIKIFSTITNQHSTATTIIFVNDPYDVIDSIKGEEHAKRNYVHGSKNVYIKAVDELQNKTNLSKNFTNKSNKIRSQNYLKMEFQRLSQSYPKKTFIYSVQRNCEDLKTGTKLPSYECNHQEADTIMFFIIHALRQVGNDSTIVIDAEDTDVIALSYFASHQENGVLGIRRKKSIFDCNKYLPQSLHR